MISRKGAAIRGIPGRCEIPHPGGILPCHKIRSILQQGQVRPEIGVEDDAKRIDRTDGRI